jgi:hypothetical protein
MTERAVLIPLGLLGTASKTGLWLSASSDHRHNYGSNAPDDRPDTRHLKEGE